MTRVYIGLGGNVGDSSATIIAALDRLCATYKNKCIALSSPYSTPPWGNENQAQFINACAIIETNNQPESLLRNCQDVEAYFGRKRIEKWGPRTIDIDLLVMDGVSQSTDQLSLPHPYLTQRAFVLLPLKEIAPKLEIAGKTVEKWCDTINSSEIVRLQPKEYWIEFIQSHMKAKY